MLWSEVIDNWENGIPFSYPESLKNKNKFFWNTSPLTENGESQFSEKFKESLELPNIQSRTAFKDKLIKAEKNGKQHATSFPNLSGDTVLVIPMPKGKCYATLKDFVDNAPKKQQQELWKLVAKEAKKQAKKFGKVWISTHGLGVPYLHVRISSQPKYYFSKALAEK